MKFSKFMIKWFKRFVDSGFSFYVANEHYFLLHHSVLNIKLNLLKMQSHKFFYKKKPISNILRVHKTNTVKQAARSNRLTKLQTDS